MRLPLRAAAVLAIAAAGALGSVVAARAGGGDFEDALIEARCVPLHAARLTAPPGNTVFEVTCRGRSSTITVTCRQGECVASDPGGTHRAEARLHPRD